MQTLTAVLAVVTSLTSASVAFSQMPVLGDYWAHDPSTMTRYGSRYYVYRTSDGIMGKYSTDLRNWTYSGQVFPSGPPSWTSNAVPGFTGTFWAPDIVKIGATYFLYYAVSTWGSQVSAIGLVTTTNLDSGPWTDQGAVIQSTNGNPYNTIDPSILVDTNGTMWMAFGSYWNGIYLVQLDPATGKRISANSPLTQLADNSSIEASCLVQHGGYYYLFVDWGACCSGVDSTYNIRVGRGTSVTGPYLDRNGVNMVSGGGSMFLESTGRYIGPGHAGIMNDNGTNWFTYHYYDGNDGGTAKLGLTRLTWGDDGWPALTNDWSALYTFDTDAREHSGLYNGSFPNGATITNDPNRGKVLLLDGVSQYVVVSNSVANASTFAAWVKWYGGSPQTATNWQRIFDFGTNTSEYLFLTPRANTGVMRFAINNGGGEQQINAPIALPTNSWCHVAVTLDGSRGVLYLNANPIATNTSLTIRPWQLLCKSNYLGRSQFAADPYFNGEIDSFRVFSRALSAAEVRDDAYAHPALAHRYSFNSVTNISIAWDSIGMAHGTLMGNAVITNNALKLPGTSDSYVNLPGGVVSGSSAVTVEFWATFGANGNWARVFDFGNSNGTSGSQYFFFSPHTSLGGQRMEMNTSNLVTMDISGTLDNRTVFVTCIVDPASNYGAVYTNGVLEQTFTASWPAFGSVSTAWSFIGRSLWSGDAPLNATIDEFRVYDGRLTPEQIAVDYKYGPDALALPVSLSVSNSPPNFKLSWPSYAVGFNAESTTSLNSASWSTVPASAVLSNDAWNVALPTTNAAGFFRLHR